MTLDRLVLHIGTSKTGSTAIQGSLLDASEELLGQGILYPVSGRSGPGHAKLSGELISRDSPVTHAPSHRALLAEARAHAPKALVVSAEGLTPRENCWGVEWALHLAEELRPKRVQVVAYVRPQWEYMEAMYSQRVKVGLNTESCEAYVEGLLKSNFYDYVWKFDPWRRAFGAHLIVRPYGPAYLADGDAVSDFWQLVGLGKPPEARAQYSNRRPGNRELAVLRALSARLADRHHDLPVRRLLEAAAVRIRNELPNDTPFAGIDADLTSRVAARFAESNAEFVRELWKGEHADFFAPRGNGHSAPPDSAELSESEVALLDELTRDALAAAPAGSSAGSISAPLAPTSRSEPASQGAPAQRPRAFIGAIRRGISRFRIVMRLRLPWSALRAGTKRDPTRRCLVCSSPLIEAPPNARCCSQACRSQRDGVRRVIEGPQPASAGAHPPERV